MNLYLVEIREFGLYSVVASNRDRCDELVRADLRNREEWNYLDDISKAVEKAQWFSLNTAVNWEAGITNFY